MTDHPIQIEDLPATFREIAEAIGLSAAWRLMQVRGGERIYIPKTDCINAAARNRAIRAEFNGANIRELARKYGLTKTWVREILSDAGIRSKSEPVGTQLKLF